MNRLNWEEGKEAREKEAVAEHERLHRLFVEDRLSFERERKGLIDRIINKAETEEQRERLRALQNRWDKRMKGAGSRYNRFILAQTFFWEHFHETWSPAIRELSQVLDALSSQK